MQHTFDFDTHPGAVVITLTGRAVLDGFDAYLTALVADPRTPTGIVVDARALDVSSLSLTDIEQIGVRQRDEAIDGVRVALVVSSALAFGRARQFEALASTDHGPVRSVFRSISEAMTWLQSAG